VASLEAQLAQAQADREESRNWAATYRDMLFKVTWGQERGRRRRERSQRRAGRRRDVERVSVKKGKNARRWRGSATECGSFGISPSTKISRHDLLTY
jgi:hypothetical protein